MYKQKKLEVCFILSVKSWETKGNETKNEQILIIRQLTGRPFSGML